MVRIESGWLHRLDMRSGTQIMAGAPPNPKSGVVASPAWNNSAPLSPRKATTIISGPTNQIQGPGGGNNRTPWAAPDPLHTHAPRLNHLKVQQDQPPVLREAGLANTQVLDRARWQESLGNGRRRADVPGLCLELDASFGWVSHVVGHDSENLFPVSCGDR